MIIAPTLLACEGLEQSPLPAYHMDMDTTPRTTVPDDWDPPTPSRDELLKVLAESEAEAKAGSFVSGDKVIRELYEAAAQLGVTAAEPRKSGSAPGR